MSSHFKMFRGFPAQPINTKKKQLNTTYDNNKWNIILISPMKWPVVYKQDSEYTKNTAKKVRIIHLLWLQIH